MLYKDLSIVNHRTDEDMRKVLAEIAKLLHDSNKESLRNTLLKTDGKKITSLKKHHPKHNNCSGIRKTDNKELSEKRICRCMYYYKQNCKKCENCLLEKKWLNTGKIKITNYEWPTDHVFNNVGGMDLILDDKYAAEVKPYDSDETLTRMIAEILTYTSDCSLNYFPAICFFENSKQEKDFNNYKNDKDLKFILNYVKVFKIIIKEDLSVCKFEIIPLDID